jgi:hypothetical protein
MSDPNSESDHASIPRPVLDYGRPRPPPRIALTPAQERRQLAWIVSVMLLLTFVWMFTMFLTRRPALDYFCVLAFTPLVLAMIWGVVGWLSFELLRRHPASHRRRLVSVGVVCFLLAAYTVPRAGKDMFTLSLRYHLWRAGGAENVRAAFIQWAPTHPDYDPKTGVRPLFLQKTARGNFVPIPSAQLPPLVTYIHERYPDRWGSAQNGVVRISYVYVLTTTDITIGPRGWRPNRRATFWEHVTGSRRQLADGIWLQFGMYDK